MPQVLPNSAYDSSRRYAGACDDQAVYWTDTGAIPNCETTRNMIDKDDFLCDAAADRLAVHGSSTNMLVQFRNGGSDGESVGPYRWQFLATGHSNSPVECQADNGKHGDGRSKHLWPSAGTNVSDPFTARAQGALSWGSTPRNRRYVVFDGNYLNWSNSTGSRAQPQTSAAEISSRTIGSASYDDFSCAMNSARSFTKPAIAVNSFNRTRHLSDIYLVSAEPRFQTHWPGNLKKYRVSSNGIDYSSEFWAAGDQIPAPTTRNLYSNIVSLDLTVAGNAIKNGNDALEPAVFGLTGAAAEPTLEELVDWARGADVRNADGNSTTGRRDTMGDSLHAQPAAVVYGGDASNPDTIIYSATNDGYLHAISGHDGQELWAFIPEQLLANLTRLYFDPEANHKQYGLDGDIVPVIKDVDQDGTIEADDGDFVYLLLGMRRGGQTYFALDVTDRQAPSLLWIFDSKESGESWSKPSVTRMHVAGALQNDDKAVVVIGGGYDTVHDSAAHPAGADGSGAGIHVLDLVTGERLWRAGMDAGAELPLNAMGREMDRSIPNQVRVIDLNSDGLADRMYASDLGGQIWRFDVHNGQNAKQLVTGGIIAQLGANGSRTQPSAAQTRRFYNAPDISLITDNHQQKRYIAISIGSGYRAHPFDTSADDRFFTIRDPDVFKPLTQHDYDNYSIITDADLIEVAGRTQTVVGVDDHGWMLTLPPTEKVLTESFTFNDQVYFISFDPGLKSDADCRSLPGENNLYRLNVLNGDPVAADAARYEMLQQGGIAPAPTILFPDPAIDCSGDQCTVRPLACFGEECFVPDLDAAPVRTLWTQAGID